MIEKFIWLVLKIGDGGIETIETYVLNSDTLKMVKKKRYTVLNYQDGMSNNNIQE